MNTGKRRYIPNIIKACCLSFKGNTDSKVAEILGVSSPTISHWRKLPIWKQTEEKLIEKTIDNEINQDLPNEADAMSQKKEHEYDHSTDPTIIKDPESDSESQEEKK